jgi:hypothetical protein
MQFWIILETIKFIFFNLFFFYFIPFFFYFRILYLEFIKINLFWHILRVNEYFFSLTIIIKKKINYKIKNLFGKKKKKINKIIANLTMNNLLESK